ncbi:MAG: hypothetical protein ACLT98_05945 [Eggerthellaceae bacterium]
MSDAFDGIIGQPKVREFLRSCVSSDRVSHAYLFCGPAGSRQNPGRLCVCARYPLQKAIRARIVKAARLRRVVTSCVKPIPTCTTLPAGRAGLRGRSDTRRHGRYAAGPHQAKRKVYIIDRVDVFGDPPQTRFSKRSRPPSDVVLILLGRTRESVLPTIVSRCQVVPFRHI